MPRASVVEPTGPDPGRGEASGDSPLVATRASRISSCIGRRRLGEGPSYSSTDDGCVISADAVVDGSMPNAQQRRLRVADMIDPKELQMPEARNSPSSAREMTGRGDDDRVSEPST